jgi:hypothetical protein
MGGRVTMRWPIEHGIRQRQSRLIATSNVTLFTGLTLVSEVRSREYQ